MHRVLCFGGRGYNDAAAVAAALQILLDAWGPKGFIVVQGGARGADALCKSWAMKRGIPSPTLDAAWDFYGKPAGGIRNQWMLDIFTPTHAVGFPGGPGSRDMAKRCEAIGLTPWFPFGT